MPNRRKILRFLLLIILLGCGRERPEAIHIIYTGGLLGYLEPCGCREGRVGGFARLAGSIQDSLSHWNGAALVVDAGDFAESYGPDLILRNRVILEALSHIAYQAVNVTAHDLQAGHENLLWAADTLGIPFISANLRDKESGRQIFPGWVIKTAGGKRIGVIGLGAIRPLEMMRAQIDDLIYADPDSALADALQQLHGRCDYAILLCDLPARVSREWAAANSDLSLIISTMELAPSEKPRKFGFAYVLGASRKGKRLTTAVLEAGTADSLALSCSQALLDSTSKEDPRVSGLIEAYKKTALFNQKP